MNTQQIDSVGRPGERRRAPRLGMGVCVLAPSILALQSASAQNLFFGSVAYAGGQKDALYTTDLDGNGLKNILPAPGMVSGVAADGASKLVFWKDHITGGKHGSYTMHVADFSGGSHAVIASWNSAGGNNYGVAADRVNKRVFWTDLNGVNSANYDGTGAIQVLASFNAEDVEVDPAAGKLFWVDGWGGASVTLNVANLNGSSPQTLATLPGGTVVSGLTVNPLTQTVLWSDYVAGTISAIPYAGGATTTVLSGHQFVSGLEFEVTTNRLYMVNKGNASVSWIPPTGGVPTTVYVGSGGTLGEMWDIAAVVPAPGSLVLLVLTGLVSSRPRR
ncbi:MAG: hypothetical protein AMXMBFR77_21420 [Phycisphaerales bacterium]|nr:hypothetical protein [Leptolyngbya sp.]MCZ7634491.1 hypothetical protein [Phycisphaerales bacterium]MDL1904711.1 hypothetical protein [Synechococcales cyanobacterium CNB]GIK19807.1 MAG: hypothetical protein BroJett004_19710 [Planctomycetota bacterium]